MKRIFTTTIVMLTIIYVMPFIYSGYGKAITQTLDQDERQDIQGDELDNPIIQPENDIKIKVLIGDTVKELTLENYVCGVVCAEIPASFPEDALKAQAVAARTYTMYKKYAIDNGGAIPDRHKGAIVCDDSKHCKAYIDIDAEAETLWKSKAAEYKTKIKKAVFDTSGQILTYGDAPIAAVFHCAASNKTENAKDVWNSDTPYLLSVDSPGSDAYNKYNSQVTLTENELKKRLLEAYPDMKLNQPINQWFKASNRSDAGGIINVAIGGVRVKGTALRSILGLNSTNFTIEPSENSIIFKTTGYGHGVGMSQYGAKYLAEQGKTYKEILYHYYTNVNLEKISS